MTPDSKLGWQEDEPARSEDKYWNEICRVGRWMYERGLAVAGEGNLSVRLGAGRILITPAGAWQGMLAPEGLLVIDPGGGGGSGKGQPSSETPMRLLFYRGRAGGDAVFHAHSPT